MRSSCWRPRWRAAGGAAAAAAAESRRRRAQLSKGSTPAAGRQACTCYSVSQSAITRRVVKQQGSMAVPRSCDQSRKHKCLGGQCEVGCQAPRAQVRGGRWRKCVERQWPFWADAARLAGGMGWRAVGAEARGKQAYSCQQGVIAGLCRSPGPRRGTGASTCSDQVQPRQLTQQVSVVPAVPPACVPGLPWHCTACRCSACSGRRGAAGSVLSDACAGAARARTAAGNWRMQMMDFCSKLQGTSAFWGVPTIRVVM